MPKMRDPRFAYTYSFVSGCLSGTIVIPASTEGTARKYAKQHIQKMSEESTDLSRDIPWPQEPTLVKRTPIFTGRPIYSNNGDY